MSQDTDALYLEALQLPAGAERDVFLGDACKDHPEMRQRLDALLADNTAADAFFDEPATVGALSGVSSTPGEKPGDRIGRYKLLQEIGAGGFGTVWRAEQFDPITREVAVKVIRPGMDSAEIVARFAAEQQALALMYHPNIAAVLDAGQTDAGRPYFVMELVKGEPITTWCDANRLTVRRRLELFDQVCQAVHHAHQKAVLHRDLKPSNILVEVVDGLAIPKIIDFGIAKALQAGIAPQFEADLVQTIEGTVIGTPQYMSPEQAGSSRDIDTRSDVYALGAILYELLTGETPLCREIMRGAGIEHVLRTIREGIIRRPSSILLPARAIGQPIATARATTVKRLSASIQGELDWITLKSLEKDRERRYDSALAFALDVQRFLKDQPVTARAPTVSYRLKKFVKRHRGLVMATNAILLTLGAAAVVTSWLATSARWSRYLKDQAERKVESQNASVATANSQAHAEKRKAEDAARKAALAGTTAETEKAAAAEARRGLLLAADQAKKNADRIHQQNRTISTADQASAQQAFVDGDWRKGVAYLGRSLRHNIDNLNAQQALWIALACGDGNADPLPQTRWVTTGSYEVHTISPDGSRVLLTAARSMQEAGPDGKLRPMRAGPPEVRNARSGSLIATLESAGEVGFRGAIFSPNGQRIVTRLYEGPSNVFSHEAMLFDATTGKLLGKVPCYEMTAFSPDSKRLVTDATQATVSIWDANNARKSRDLGGGTGLSGRALSAQFSPDGSRVAFIHEGGSLAVWNITTGKKVFENPARGVIPGRPNLLQRLDHLVQFSPDGTRLVTLVPGVSAKLWGAIDGKPIALLDSGAVCAAFTPDGTGVVVASNNGCSIWDAEKGQVVDRREFPKENFQISPDGRCLLVGGKIWDFESQTFLCSLFPVKTSRGKTVAQFAADSQTVVAAADRGVCSFAVPGPKIKALPLPHPMSLVHAAFSPIKALPLPHPHPMSLVHASFSPDAARVVTTTGAGDGKDTRAFGRPPGTAATIEIVGRASTGATVERDWIDLRAFVWDAASGVLLTTIPACGTRAVVHRTATSVSEFGSFIVAQFSPDNKRIVTVSKGNEATIWDAETGEARANLHGHTDNIFMARFSPDGRRVMTAAGDRTVRVWDATSGSPTAAPLTHPDFLVRADFSEDGTRIFSETQTPSQPGGDSTVTEWDSAAGKQIFRRSSVNRSELQAVYLPAVPTGREARCRLAPLGPDFQIYEAVDERTILQSQDLRGIAIGPRMVARFGAAKSLPSQVEGGFIAGMPVPGLRGEMTSDFTRAVTSGDCALARIWDISTSQILHDSAFAEKLTAFAGGAKLNPGTGVIDPLKPHERLDLYAELRPVLEDSNMTDWRVMAERILNQRHEAQWSCRGKSTVRDVCTTLIMSGSKEHLLEAYCNDPGHPLIHFAFSRFQTNPKAAAFLKDFSRRRVLQLPPDEQLAFRALASRLQAMSKE